MNISNLDHLVLTVKDINITAEFYESVLGMIAETFGDGRISLKYYL
jgi:catechol 2,3-dioxygenase-like lactoylglutathione lyase family enzyme